MPISLPFNTWIVVPLILISIFLASLFKRQKVKSIFFILFTILIVMELISVYFSGGFVDYQFYVNLNLNDVIEGFFIFKMQAVLAIVVFFILIFIQSKLTNIVQKKLHVILRLAICVAAFLPLTYPNGPLTKLIEIYQVTSADKVDFEAALLKLEMSNYPQKSQIHAEQGKNIIVISLESFEQGFLDIEGITPNLNKLKQKYSFYSSIPMAMGSSWTTASMYTYMTGIPLLVGGIDPLPLGNVSSTQLVSLGDVLSNAGYQSRYIIGEPNFAGIGHIISMFDIDIICEKSYPGEYPKAPFGLYDKDIFDIAKRQVNELSQEDKPFALFISTISTHAPKGFYDKRMEAVIDPKSDNMSFVAASLDYQLGQFIDYLADKDILENTVFYIFPDHLMMGAGTPTIAQLSQRDRFLYLLTNAEQTDLNSHNTKNIYQIDFPRLILNGAQINTNARFLTDYIDKSVNKKEFIQRYKSAIATLNRSAGVE